MAKVRRVKNISALYNFIGYVVLCAPDHFPYEDYLDAADQMSLEKAFGELREAVQLIDAEVAPPKRRTHLYALLDQSLGAYRRRDVVSGAHLLQDFRNLVFEDPDKKHN